MSATPLSEMRGPQRAALLAELFPGEMDRLFTFIEGMCHSMLQDTALTRSLAAKRDIPYQQWMKALRKTLQLLEKHRHNEENHVLLMAMLMSFDDIEYFNMHCIVDMRKTHAPESADEQTFHYAIQMLFG